MAHELVATNGIRLHVVQAGPPEGPLLILLHGFPETSYGWHHQTPALAAAGYRVWVPDQRGYNSSDKPRGVAAYNLDLLAADVVGLIDAAGKQTASVIGHDWGGAVAWWIAAKYPHRLDRLVVLNAPHGAVMQRNLRHNSAQRRRSWYMFFFQLPFLPELLSRRRGWRLLTQTLRTSSRQGTFSEADLDEYRQAWSQPGAYSAMLNWYRAMFRSPPRPPPRQPITVPTLLIWGGQDRFLGRELAEQSIRRCSAGQLVFVDNSTHWLHHEQPTVVTALIEQFLRDAAPAEQASGLETVAG
jgi:pimeloyl-ACP methyl ester carboxylesterase